MLRTSLQIRLTRRECDRWLRITGVSPDRIRTAAEFDAYVERCRAIYTGLSEDSRFLRWLIERERARCLA